MTSHTPCEPEASQQVEQVDQVIRPQADQVMMRAAYSLDLADFQLRHELTDWETAEVLSQHVERLRAREPKPQDHPVSVRDWVRLRQPAANVIRFPCA